MMFDFIHQIKKWGFRNWLFNQVPYGRMFVLFADNHSFRKRINLLESSLQKNENPSQQEEIGSLRLKVQKLQKELTEQRENNEKRNRELDALHYVWCDGGCNAGVHRYSTTKEDLTQEHVKLAVRNTKRLVSWWNNFHYKKNNYKDHEPTYIDPFDFPEIK